MDEGHAERRVYRATLARTLEHHPGTQSFFLRLPAGERLAFTPGQFISCALPVGGATPLVRAYSDVAPGRACALVGSSGRLEIAVRCGRADALPGVAEGARVVVRRRGAGVLHSPGR